ncbi:MAG: hypothetical protein WC332_02190 [Clostridia bacterium]|jgi:hypothetical protein
MTTCRNCYTNGKCSTCPERDKIITEFEIEEVNVEQALNSLPMYMFGAAVVLAAVGLIVLTNIYL